MYLSAEKKVQNQAVFEKLCERWELSWKKKKQVAVVEKFDSKDKISLFSHAPDG